MSRYFFHLHGGRDGALVDHEGRWLSDDRAIPQAALAEVRAIIAAEALEGYIDMRQWLDISDVQGRLVHRLAFRDAVAIHGAGGVSAR